MEVLYYKNNLFNGCTLEYSFCRYKYMLNIINEAKKFIKIKYIYIIFLRLLRDSTDYSDILFYKKTLNYNYFQFKKYDKKRMLIIKNIFETNISNFLQEKRNIIKISRVFYRETNNGFILNARCTNYKSLAKDIFIDRSIFLRLIKLYITCNFNSNIDINIILIYIYHLLFLYQIFNINFINIKNKINLYTLISSPILNQKPYTFFSIFPFLEKKFGSLGFFKNKIIIDDDVDLFIMFKDKLIYSGLEIFRRNKDKNQLNIYFLHKKSIGTEQEFIFFKDNKLEYKKIKEYRKIIL
jgi:hypothetical protein